MIDAMLKLTRGIGFDEAIKIEDGDELLVAILKRDGTNLQLLRLPHVRIEDDGSRSSCKPVLVRVMIDVAKGGRFETEEVKRKAAIEGRDRDWSHALKQAVESVFLRWSDFHEWPATPDVESVCAWFKHLIEEYPAENGLNGPCPVDIL